MDPFPDADLLEYVINMYRVLLTQSIKGTYVYTCDPALREHPEHPRPPPPDPA